MSYVCKYLKAGAVRQMSYKLVSIGDASTGKTSLLASFDHNAFDEHRSSTIGVEFSTVEHSGVKMTLWDTAGQERYRTLTSSYYRGADIVLIVYAVSDRDSFQNIESWLRELSTYGDTSTLRVLVGNKTDVEPRAVGFEEGQAFAHRHGLSFAEVSVRTGAGVFQLLDWMVGQIRTRPPVHRPAPKVTRVTPVDTRRDSCCAY